MEESKPTIGDIFAQEAFAKEGRGPAIERAAKKLNLIHRVQSIIQKGASQLGRAIAGTTEEQKAQPLYFQSTLADINEGQCRDIRIEVGAPRDYTEAEKAARRRPRRSSKKQPKPPRSPSRTEPDVCEGLPLSPVLRRDGRPDNSRSEEQLGFHGIGGSPAYHAASLEGERVSRKFRTAKGPAVPKPASGKEYEDFKAAVQQGVAENEDFYYQILYALISSIPEAKRQEISTRVLQIELNRQTNLAMLQGETIH